MSTVFRAASGALLSTALMATSAQECPPSSVFGQRPHQPGQAWELALSELNAEHIRYEDFVLPPTQICGLAWWGIQAGDWGYGLEDCSELQPEYRITFYEDMEGYPGVSVCQYLVTAQVQHTGVLYGRNELLRFVVSGLTPCCKMDTGWVSIEGLGDPECRFYWLSAREGNGRSYGVPGGLANFDLSLCLLSNQPGACCYADASCQVQTEAACRAAFGAWHGPGTSCEQNPCTPACLRWEALATTGPVPARLGAALTFDRRRGVVLLFGGLANETPLNDLWEWDGQRWQRRTVSGPWPPPRTSASFAFDDARGVAVLFGGVGRAGLLGDTWLWDGVAGRWQQATVSGPLRRSAAAMAYDPVSRRVLLFGGLTDARDEDTPLNDTWAWNGSVWTELSPASSPPARAAHALAYSAVNNGLLLFGGARVTGLLEDTWLWDGAQWRELNVSGPVARALHALAPDTRDGVVLCGGQSAELGTLGDTWHWDGNTWQPAAALPGRRLAHGLVFDPDKRVTVLFGGFGDALLSDTWQLELGGPQIITPPTDQTACAGAEALLTVSAVGTGMLSYQWYRDGKPLADGGNVAGATGPTLRITPVTSADAGQYDVAVADECGTAVSTPVALDVLSATEIVRQPQDVTVVERGQVVLRVGAVGANLRYQWLKDGRTIRDGDNVAGSASAILRISTVQVGDAGRYAVRVSGDCGELTSATATLTVLPDRDGDTVPDNRDNCPDQPNFDQRDTDGDGLGDVCDDDQSERPEPELPDSAFIRALIALISGDENTDLEHFRRVVGKALETLQAAGDESTDGAAEGGQEDESARPGVPGMLCPAASGLLLLVTSLGAAATRRR